MPKFEIEILNIAIEGQTGHHKLTARIVETSDDGLTVTTGVPETFGADGQHISDAYGGDPMLWLGQHYQKLLNAHQRRSTLHTSMQEWAGKKFSAEDLTPTKDANHA